MAFPKMKWLERTTMLLVILGLATSVFTFLGSIPKLIPLVVIGGAIIVVLMAALKLSKGERMYKELRRWKKVTLRRRARALEELNEYIKAFREVPSTKTMQKDDYEGHVLRLADFTESAIKYITQETDKLP
jgi:hypothetical protein